MTTFADLKTEVQTLVIDTPTAVTTLVGNFVNRAIRKLQQKHNFKVMESEIEYQTTSLSRTLGARQGDWKEARGNPYYLSESGSLREMHWASSRANALARYGDNVDFHYGAPRLLVENDLSSELEVFPYPDGLSDYTNGEYRVTVPYWKFVGKLIADGDTNWFCDNAEQWIIYQAVSEAFYANEDENRAATWEKRAMAQYNDVLLADKRRRLAETTTLVPHLGAYMPHTQE
jgi:hypothetical protein